MDSENNKNQVFVPFRKPLPPSDNYKFLTNSVNACHTGSTRFSSARHGTLGHSSVTSGCNIIQDYRVPKNTPYRQIRCYQEGFNIHPLHPKGPPPLPPRKILPQGMVGYMNSTVTDEEDDSKPQEPEFTLNDFLLHSNQQFAKKLQKTTNVTFSRENYLKLTSWFATQKPRQRVVSNWLAEIEVVSPDKRIPGHQLFLEFRTILKSLQEESIEEVPSTALADNNEAVDALIEEQDSADFQQWSKDSSHSILIKSSTSRFFCGEGRSRSPFESVDQLSMTPAEAAILSATVAGGTQLSLKAHFLSELPNISHLTSTLSYLNLSYNSFQVFPTEVLHLPKLAYLRMRSNPVKEIPSGITMLTNLRLLSLPFNLLSELPPGLFELVNLRTLDISHNTIEWIPRDIARLRNLKKLNVECNQLIGLPSTILSLSQLTQLRTDGNYFHPILWRENTRNQPQPLTEICCQVVSSLYSEDQLQPYSDIFQNIKSDFYCDECNKKVYGTGLRLIRTNGQEQLLGHRHLPLIFQVCSPRCHKVLKACHEITWNKEWYKT